MKAEAFFFGSFIFILRMNIQLIALLTLSVCTGLAGGHVGAACTTNVSINVVYAVEYGQHYDGTAGG